MRSSTKIALGFVALVAGGYFGYSRITEAMIMGKVFAPLEPGRVNLLGVDTGYGYRIVVQNQIATLVQGGADEFGAPDDAQRPTEGGEVAGRRRIPISDMLKTLRGDQEALSRLVMTMNDLRESELPPVRVLWDSEDIARALEGDPELRAKLIDDLGVNLDGSPREKLRLSSLENGIVVRSPVTVRVPIEGRTQSMTGYVLEAYRPIFASVVTLRYADKAEVTDSMILGYLADESAKLRADPSKQEDVAASLGARISRERLQRYAAAPERVLQSATVVINEGAIVDASFNEKLTTNSIKVYDLRIDLTDEGRQRLWQYSKHRVGTQLLLVVDGIAIGAPRIEHELAGGQVTISQLPDRTLVSDAVEIMNESKRNGKQP